MDDNNAVAPPEAALKRVNVCVWVTAIMVFQAPILHFLLDLTGLHGSFYAADVAYRIVNIAREVGSWGFLIALIYREHVKKRMKS